MKNENTEYVSSLMLNDVFMKRLDIFSNMALFIAGMITFIILSGWSSPAFSTMLPDDWFHMQASTTLYILILIIASAFKKNKYLYKFHSFFQYFIIFYILLISITFVEHWYDGRVILGHYLVADELLYLVHPTSLQTISCLLVLALSLFIDHTQQGKYGVLLDILIFILLLLNFLYLSGYIFQASQIVKQSSNILISVQTLISIILLTSVEIIRRAPYGVYSTFVSTGTAGKTTRIMLPTVIIFTFMILFSQLELTKLGVVDSSYISVINFVASSAILIVMVILLTQKSHHLETKLRDMSITDELTKIYNLRGVNLYGRQILLNAKRYKIPLTILFIDADGLKKVNDTLGHDAGSQLLCDIATLLEKNFRDTDIVGRVGGDEYAVIAHGNDLEPALKRIEEATNDANENWNRPYPISFSIGQVIFDPTSEETLEELLNKADVAMYENKKERYAMLQKTNTLR